MNRVTAGFRKRVSPILLTLLIFVSTKSPALPQTRSDALKISVTERAAELARTGRTEEAVRLLQDDLAAQPGNLDTRLALAEIYAKSGQIDKALEEFRETLRLHPGSHSAEMALADFYIAGGDLEAAERVLADAVRRDSESASTRVELAFVLAREHKYADAEVHLRRVPVPADRNARVRYFRLAASIYSGLGQAHAAAHAAEQALQTMPADEELQLVAALAEEEAGEWQLCIRNATRLYEAHPAAGSGLVLLRAQLASHADFTSTLQSLRSLDLPQDQKLNLRIRSAEVLAAADYHREAVEELQEALKIRDGQDGALRYDLAVEQYHARQLDAASATLATLRKERNSAAIENLAGDIEEQRGNSLVAVHAYQNAVVLAPHEEQYWLSLGGELLKYQTYEPALSVFQQAARLFPESARIYVGLGMADYFLDKYDDSVRAFLNADKLDRGSDLAISYLGVTQVSLPDGPSPAAVDAICGHADSPVPKPGSASWCGALLFRKAFVAGDRSAAPEAIRRLRIAAGLAPVDPVAVCSLGRALAWTEQWAEARQRLEVCVRLQPGSGVEHYELGRIYQRLGLVQAAREQSDLARKATSQTDQREDLTKRFIYEVPSESKGAKDSNLPGWPREQPTSP